MGRSAHPLNALRAFEASARHLSFAKAAKELHVTPAAVSHQVRRLEEYLAVPLFRRLPRGLLLEPSGQTLFTDLRDVFVQLDRAVARVVETDARGPLTISVAPMFATKWLVPRLQRFAALHPEIDVRMSSSLGLVDFSRDAFDASLRVGKGAWSGLDSVELFDEYVTPMCSPRLVQSGPPLETPNDLARQVLLHDDSMGFDPSAPTWTAWLEAAGATSPDPTRGPRFGQPDHALQAAIDGAGVVLGWQRLAADDVTAGRLVAPFELSLPLGSSLYLVYPQTYASRPKVAAFRAWLLEETGLRSALRKTANV